METTKEKDFRDDVKIDPSSLTTQTIWREIAALKELMLVYIQSQDEAIKVAHDDMVRVPTDVQKAVATLKDLHGEKFISIQEQFKNLAVLRDEKFHGVEKQFLERDVRVEQTARDTKCVEASTPILCADLIWRKAGELKVGDELIAFDEDAQISTDSSNGISEGRRFKRSIVTSNSLNQDELVEVKTNLGTIKCNLEHPLLTNAKQGVMRQRWAWVKAIDIQVGEVVFSPVDVWETETSWEAGWLAGMYDGEGWLNIPKSGTPRLGIVQRASKTAEMIKDVLNKRVDIMSTSHRIGHEVWNDTVTFTIQRRPDIMKILGSIRPPRLIINSDKVWEGRRLSSKQRKAVVLSVTRIGSGVVASLSTSTKTYISAGFASHNTAVDAALATQEKAVAKQNENFVAATNKSEAATTKQIDAQGMLITTTTKGLDDKISDVKERLTTGLETRLSGIEARLTGIEQRAGGRKDLWGYAVAAIMLLIAVAAFIMPHLK